jgi:hypothetical protein
MCPANTFIYSVSIQSEPPKGPGKGDAYDDVSINGIKFACKDHKDYKYPKKFTEHFQDYNKGNKWRLWYGFEDK